MELGIKHCTVYWKYLDRDGLRSLIDAKVMVTCILRSYLLVIFIVSWRILSDEWKKININSLYARKNNQ